MFAPVAPLVLDSDQAKRLDALVRSGLTPQRVARKCRVVLLASQGRANHAIAQETGLSRPTVIATRLAFARKGVEGISLPSKRKKKSPILTPERPLKILDATLKPKPVGQTNRSVRILARHLGLVRAMGQRVRQRSLSHAHQPDKLKV